MSSRASGAWQVAVRRQLSQADAVRSGLERVYLQEAPVAFSVLRARLGADELTTAAATLAEPARTSVLAEARAASAAGRVPDPSSGVDVATLAAIGSTDAELEAMEARLVHQLALARMFGRRRGRAIFALSLVALAAVLAGLGAVLGPARGGTVSVAVGAVALSLAFGAGAVSVLG